MMASVHVSDVGVAKAITTLALASRLRHVEGLRHANVGIAAPLSRSPLRRPQPGRLGLVAFWDSDEALTAFETSHPLAKSFNGGWSARLAPLRAFGHWPGLADDVARSRAVDDDVPVVVVTLGRLRMSQAPRFFRTSARAEGAAIEAPGLLWATALALPPFVCTVSVWRSARESATYAYAHADAAHPAAIAADRRKAFHHEEAFVRFRPLAVRGALNGRNAFDGAPWVAESYMTTGH